MRDPATTAGPLFRLRERLSMSLWLIPALAVMAAIVLAEVMIAVDRRFPRAGDFWLVFRGGAENARNVLSVIAGSMVTSISLIFTVTMVVLQLASAQYSPRILRSFIRDRVGQSVLGVYIATFVYALLVLPAVRAQEGETAEFVPSLAVTGALALALVSLGLFVRYVHHIAHSIRAVTIIKSVGAETRSSLALLYPESVGDEPEEDAWAPEGAPDGTLHWERDPGVFVAVDEDELLEAAVRQAVVVRIVPVVGAFLPEGAPLFEVYGELEDPDALVNCVTVGDERTLHQDAAFGFRQLIDIAERALSPGVNDPTTAVQSIDQVHDLLRRLAGRRFPTSVRLDESGAPRVVAPRLSWEDYVSLAFDEIRQFSGRSIQVFRRLHGVLDDLLTVAPPSRRPPLERQRALLLSGAKEEFPSQTDSERSTEGTVLS